MRPGVEHIGENMRLCYETLVRRGWVGEPELQLLEAWLDDLNAISAAPKAS
jgi:hypothetical protein